jgi:drug/metabolite transporter (DMT)-like permease
LIVGFQPVLTAIWLASNLRGSDQPGVSRREWLGLLLGFVGLLMVVWRKLTLGSPLDHVTPANMAFALAALLSITIGTLYQKRFVKPCDVRSASTVQLLAALVLTWPLACMETEAMRWNGELAGALAWSVLGLTLGGSSLLYMLIQRGAAASVTSLMYLVPPATAMLAWVLFDESITLATLMGTALTALGVSLVLRPSRR